MRESMGIRVECAVYKNGEVIHKFESKSFLGNFAKVLAGLISEANVAGVRDIGGASYTVRSSGDVGAGKAFVVIGTGTAAPGPDDFALTTMTELPTAHQDLEFSTYAQAYFFGTRVAGATETWSEMGLCQDLFDTGGGVRRTLLARDVLPSPVTLSPGDIGVFVYVITVAV